MKTCENCTNEHEGTYGSGRFCSTKCSRGFSTKAKRKEINEKVSKKISANANPDVKLCCMSCQNEFTVKWHKRNSKFCSKSCAVAHPNHLEYSRRGGLNSAKSQNKRSKNEILFAELCQNEFKNILTNECIFNGWDADVIIPSIKIAILWNGKWHYEKITKNHSLEQVQNRDRIKIQEIIKCGYVPYIIKDSGRYNEKIVLSEFEKLKNAI